METKQEQCHRALIEANAVREARASILRELRDFHRNPPRTRLAARNRAANLLDERPMPLDKCRLGLFLRAIPGISYVKAGSLAQSAGCSQDKPIGMLSTRQRAFLIAQLREQV